MSGSGSTAEVDRVRASSQDAADIRRALWSVALGVGLVSIAGVLATALVLVHLALRGDWYAWVIAGPGVLGMVGGGPFQLVMYVGGLLATAALLVVGVTLVRKALQVASRV